MAEYKVIDAEKLEADLTSVADTIRAKGGTTDQLEWPEGYKAAVNDIETGMALPTLSDPGTAEDLRAGKQLIDQEGNVVTGTALVAGGGGVKPDGAFAPVRSFTAGKQYALVAVIDGVRRYINNTAYNDWTLNATQIAIAEDAGDYVLFDKTPVMFTAVASGNGFLLQTGSDYLYGVFDGGTALRIGTTQTVWLVDESATAGLPDGKFYPKEDADSVWLTSTHDDYDWYPKYETAGSFGYDRVGRDDTYSTGFVSFVLYENVAGEGELNPVMDTTTENPAGSGDILKGKEAFVNGKKVVGDMNPGANVAGVTATPDKVVAPYVFVDKDGNPVTGTLEPVKRYEGEFVVSYDSQKRIYVDCGFTPDAVMLSGLMYEGDQTGTRYQYDFAVLFPESVAGAIRVLDGYGSNSDYYSADAYQTANGFMLQYFGYYDGDNNWVEPTGQTYRYVAIKYTESIPAEFDTSVITATPSDVAYPKVFIDKDGVTRSGTLKVQTYYYGADEPSADLGVDGDLYFVMGG